MTLKQSNKCYLNIITQFYSNKRKYLVGHLGTTIP